MVGKNKQRLDKIENKNRMNTIDYRYNATGADIKMKHLITVNLFALEMDGKTSLFDRNRGYSIIKKWKDPEHSNELSIRGDIRDIEIDNIFACGGKITR